MLVATTVATDTRVLREATSLAGAGHDVHVIGRSVPQDWTPPGAVTVSSVGTSSVFRAEGSPSLSTRRLPPHLRLARWALLPQHRASAFGRWSAGVVEQGLERIAAGLTPDVVHAHDYTALEAGATLADAAGAALVYDTHELWSGRPREYRPTPLADARERRVEGRLGSRADAVITVGDGVAEALRARYGWGHVAVVRNTFPRPPQPPAVPAAPTGLVYAGRLAAYRELETIAAASDALATDPGLPITLVGPADSTWLAGFDPHRTTVEAPLATDDVDARLTAAGLVLVTHSDRWENHRLALPNKLFHAVRAGAPVVATDVGELAAAVRAHGLGTLYAPGDPNDLVRAVREAVADYPALRDRVAAAAGDLSWERDEQVLRGVYERLATRAADAGRRSSSGDAPRADRPDA